MRQSLQNELVNLEEAEVQELALRIEKAGWIKSMMQGFQLDLPALAKAVKIDLVRFKLLARMGDSFTEEEAGKMKAFDYEFRMSRMRQQKNQNAQNNEALKKALKSKTVEDRMKASMKVVKGKA